ncbi:unnamed protein product [Amoebophrya sp. A25]|nr:unnamed protein product [Amoebophrya sp. A25]|eukprot:GSA25T00018003001.1
MPPAAPYLHAATRTDGQHLHCPSTPSGRGTRPARVRMAGALNAGVSVPRGRWSRARCGDRTHLSKWDLSNSIYFVLLTLPHDPSLRTHLGVPARFVTAVTGRARSPSFPSKKDLLMHPI